MAEVFGNRIIGVGTVPANTSAVNRFYMDNKYYPGPDNTKIGSVLSKIVSNDWNVRTGPPPVLSTYLNNIKAIPDFNGGYIGHYFTSGMSNSLRFAYSTNGISWVLRTAGQNLDDILRFAGGNNVFIFTTGGNNGRIHSSTDSIHWTQTYSVGPGVNLDATIFANGQFLVFSRTNGYVSADGINWTARTIGTAQVADIACTTSSPTIYLIGGHNINGFISASTDTIHWSTRTIPVNNYSLNATSVRSLAYGNNLYVGGGRLGYIITSTNSIEWTVRTAPVQVDGLTPNTTETVIKSIEYIDNSFMAIGQGANGSLGQILSSTDGINWFKTYNTSSTGTLKDISYHPIQKRVIVSGSPTGIAPEILTCDVGKIDWSRPKGIIEYTTPGTYAFKEAVNAQHMYVEVIGAGGGGAAGIPFPTVQASTASYVSAGAGGNGGGYLSAFLNRGDFIAPNFGGALEIFVGKGGFGGNTRGLAISTNGIVWTHRCISNRPNSSLIGVFKLGNTYVTTSFSNLVVTSTDTISWTFRSTPFLQHAGTSKTLTATGQEFVYSACVSSVAVTTDGITWMFRTALTSSNIFKVASEESRIAVVATDDNPTRICTSTDGIIWTLRTSGISAASGSQIAYRPFGSFYGLYLMGCNNGSLIVSTDAVVWIQRTTGIASTKTITAVYGRANLPHNLYLFGCGTGELCVSTDTIHWILRTTPMETSSTTRTVTSINYGPIGDQEEFVAFQDNSSLVTNEGAILVSSTDTITWVLRTSLAKRGSLNRIRYSSTDGIWYHTCTPTTAGTNGGPSSIKYSINRPDLGLITTDYTLSAPGGVANVSTGGTSLDFVTNFSVDVPPPGYMVLGGISSSPSLYPTTGDVFPNGSFDGLSMTTIKRQKFQPTAGGTGSYMTGNGASVESTYFGVTIKAPGGIATTGVSSTGLTINGVSGIGYTVVSRPLLGGSGGGAISVGYRSWYLRTTGFAILASSRKRTVAVNPTGNNGEPLYVKGADIAFRVSTDTIHWVLRTTPATGGGGFITAGTYFTHSNLYLYGTQYAQLVSSTDTVHWVLRTSPYGLNSAWIGEIGFSGNLNRYWLYSDQFSSVFATSINGIDWAAQGHPFSPSNGFIAGIAEKPGQNFAIAIEEGSGLTPKLLATQNFSSWIARTVPLTSSNSVRGLKYDSNFDLYYAFGTNSLFMVSTDSIAWTLRTTDSSFFAHYTNPLYVDAISVNTVDGLRIFLADNLNFSSENRGSIRMSTDTIHWSNVDTRKFDVSGSMNYGRHLSANGPGAFAPYPAGSKYLILNQAGGPSMWVCDLSQSISIAGNGGNGGVGCGGGGGGYSFESSAFGMGGDGGNGMVRITWW